MAYGAADVGKQPGAGRPYIFPALRHSQVSQNHLRVLLKRQVYRIAESQRQGSHILSPTKAGKQPKKNSRAGSPSVIHVSSFCNPGAACKPLIRFEAALS